MALVNAATKAARHEDPTPYPYTVRIKGCMEYQRIEIVAQRLAMHCCSGASAQLRTGALM